ncbi:MAG: glucose-1-phosphate thymidylyltransferase [Anaerolineae bacterium]
MLKPSEFFDLSDPFAAALFQDCKYVWDVIGKIGEHVARLVGDKQTILGEVMPGAHIGTAPIYIGEGARIEPGAYVEGPAWIGPGAVVRHGAFVRENIIMLPNAILGHASEAKNSLFLNNAHAPHFAYVGDSVLGNNTNLGAGTKLSNLTLLSEKDKSSGKRPTIKLHVEGHEYDTGLAKFGAILGDETQTGCNSVLNPGCVIGRRCLVYANMSLRKGYYPAESVMKLRQTTKILNRKF